MQLPTGFTYCMDVLQKIKENDKLIKEFPGQVISGYRKSALPAIYGGETPPALWQFASSIAEKMSQKYITRQEVLNCDQMMYQCSGINIFKLINEV